MRISERFEERFLSALREVVSAPELKTVDHECTAVQFPVQDPSGAASLAMGISVTLACPTMAIGDHVMVTAVFQDPYLPDADLKSQAGMLASGLFRQRQAANEASGALSFPGGM